MNARGIFLSVVSLLLLGLMLTREPAALAADGESKEYAVLITRIETLERQLRDQQRSQDLVKLKLRVTELERSDESRRRSSGATSRSPAGDLVQLKREHAHLRREVTALETVVDRVEMSAAPLRREIDRLRQNVSNLQSEVKRLKSKR